MTDFSSEAEYDKSITAGYKIEFYAAWARPDVKFVYPWMHFNTFRLSVIHTDRQIDEWIDG
jgi:hypothetical protein